MGFGLGIEARARRGRVTESGRAVAVADSRLQELLRQMRELSGQPDLSPPRTMQTVVLPGPPLVVEETFTAVRLVTPDGTAQHVDLRVLPDRDAHARKLVARRALPGGRIVAERDVVGDARDLLAYVLRRRLSDSVGVYVGRGGAGRMLYFHVGRSPFVELALRVWGRPTGGWNADLDTLDGDGLVQLALWAPDGSMHVILCGGSEYGTYFSVAELLRSHFDARWLFPGAAGESLGAGPLRLFPARLDRYEEPEVRVRSLPSDLAGKSGTPVESDEARAWLLRNGLRPSLERTKVLEAAGDCPASDEDARAFRFWIAQGEERIPFVQNLSQWLPPFGASLTSIGRRLVEAMPRVFAELRVRAAGTLLPAFGTPTPTSAVLHPAVGALSIVAIDEEASDAGLVYCAGRRVPRFVPFTSREGVRAMTTGRVRVNPGDRASDPEPHLDAKLFEREAGVDFDLYCARLKLPEPRASAQSPVTSWRFVPVSYSWASGVANVAVHSQRCVFAYDPAVRPGQALRVHDGLGAEVALRLREALAGRGDRGEDRAHFLAPDDDARGWCTCDACTRAERFQRAGVGPAATMVFYRGVLIAIQRSYDGFTDTNEMLERTILVRDGAVGSARLDNLPGWSVSGRSQWNTAPQNPFASMTIDELAMRGVVTDRGYLGARSVHLVSLLNAVAGALASITTTPMTAASRPVLATLAYQLHAAAPMTQAPTSEPGRGGRLVAPSLEREPDAALHPWVMPYMTGTRDLAEYATNGADVPVGTVAGAFARMVSSPDRFNHERWALVAVQTGLYEYMPGGGLVTPRLYAERLGRALREGVTTRGLRAFLGEYQPAWSLDGPLPWVLARMLWNPFERTPEALREEYCRAAFGRAWAPMALYFEVCEAAWSRTRDRRRVHVAGSLREVPDQMGRPLDLDTWDGSGLLGRASQLSQLEGWFDDTPPLSAMRAAWSLLTTARDETAGDAASRDRVEMYRRTFGLTVLIATWVKPLRDAFEVIRQARGDLAVMSDPHELEDVVLRYVARGTAGRTLEYPVQIYPANAATAETFEMRYMAQARTVLPSALRDAVRARLTAGIRSLRNDVNKYLAMGAVQGADLMSFRYATTAGFTRLEDLGLNYSDGRGIVAGGPFPRLDPAFPERLVGGPYRTRGLGLEAVLAYMIWWNGLPTDPMPRNDAVRDRGDGHGLDWIFRGVRDLAGAVLLYANGLAMDINERRAFITNIMVG